MTFLIAGVLLWSIIHLVPSAASGVRADLAAKTGEGVFKGLFALDIIISLILIVYGWKSTTPSVVYAPPLVGSLIPSLLAMLAIVFFVASSLPNNLKRLVRHPQMAAVVLWGVGHLLSNGDSRSLVLFGGMTVWAILEMVFISKRDGAWEKPEPVPLAKDLLTAAISAVAIAILIHFHASISGVSVALPA